MPKNGLVPDYVPERYDHLSRRARWARRALFLVILVYFVDMALTFVELRLVDRARTGFVSAEEVSRLDHQQTIVGFVEIGLVILTGVLFIAWFHRAYRNLESLGAERRHGSGWAIGYWFIPILNLFRPVQMAGELWRGSEPRLGERRPSSPAVVWAWWVLSLVALGFSRIAYSQTVSAKTLDALESADHVWVAAEVVAVVATVLAMVVVTRITDRQERRARAIGRAAQPIAVAR